MVKEIIILPEYTDFANIFFKKLVKIFSKQLVYTYVFCLDDLVLEANKIWLAWPNNMHISGTIFIAFL